MPSAEDIDFLHLSPERFEELCFELLMLHNFKKLVWRRGGADSGRDIQGVRFVETNILEPFEENWFFECKRYEAGVPPEHLNSKIAWADAERPAHLVIFVSSYITTPAREWLEKISLSKPYKIHVIEGKYLQTLVGLCPTLVCRYFASDIQRLMQDAHRAWLLHNLVPEPELLRRLAAFDQIREFEIGQLAFLWASLKIRSTEVTRDMDDSYGESYDYIFRALAEHATTEKSLLVGENEWSTIQVVEELIPHELVYSKVFAAQLAHLVDKSERIALYCFVRDEDGEGLEILVDQDSSLTFAIRHVASGAKEVIEEAKKTLRIS